MTARSTRPGAFPPAFSALLASLRLSMSTTRRRSTPAMSRRPGRGVRARSIGLVLALIASAVVIPFGARWDQAAADPGDACEQTILVNTGSGIPTGNTLRTFDTTGEELSNVTLQAVYGDIALSTDGETLYGVTFHSTAPRLDTLDQASGVVLSTLPLLWPDGFSGAPNSLTMLPSGMLLVGFPRNQTVMMVDPATGVGTPFAELPDTVDGAAGDFFQLVDGDILAVAAVGSVSHLVRIHPDASTTTVGTVPLSFGAAMVSGAVFLAGEDGDIFRVPAIPVAASTEPIETVTVVSTGLPFYGATSSGDTGSCGPKLVVSKVLTSDRFAPSDQFRVEIRTGSGEGPIVNDLANAVTSGTGSTIDPGTGSTGVFAASAGTTYFLNETVIGGSELNYLRTATCIDLAGVQADLPDGEPLPAAITVLPSTDISCTITNHVMPTVTVSKVSVGDVGSFEFTGTNGVAPHVVTTTSPDAPAEGPRMALADVDAATTITEADAPGWTLTAVACTGLPAGGIATPDLAAGSVTLNAAAAQPGADIRCTFTNSRMQPGIEVVKTAEPATVTGEGQTVAYSFEVTNVGNVPLTDPVVSDTTSGTNGPVDVTCPSVTLMPGRSVTCTASYVVSQADVDAGSITNTATATATPPAGVDAPVSDPSTAIVAVDREAGLSLVKSADPSLALTPGATVTYRFAVTNTGNVTITDPSITEVEFTGEDAPPSPVCPPGPLAPGDVVVCTAEYTPVEADLLNQPLRNTATATGTPPAGMSPPTSDPSTVELPGDPTTGLALVKTVEPLDPTEFVAGGVITYRFRVTNTGNVTITDPSITEVEFSGAGSPPVPVCPTGPVIPGVWIECTASYTLVPADIDAGVVTNTATATATPPGALPPPVSSPSSAEVVGERNPALSLQKLPLVESYSTLGQEIGYELVVTNTGNVTIAEIAVVDPLASEVDCPATVLPAGEHMVCSAVHVVTQEDLDAGTFTNVATVTGTPPAGTDLPPVPPATAIVPGVQRPGLSIDKSVSPATVARAGETVTYSFVVTNTGNVTLTEPTVDEVEFSGVNALVHSGCDASLAAVAPGGSVTCWATYRVDQADVDAGRVSNVASASATDPSGGPVSSDEDHAVLLIPAAPGLSIVKSSSTTSIDGVSQEIDYSFDVGNTGNVTLSDVSVEDGRIPSVSCPRSVLAPGESMRCTGSYSVTPADLAAGGVLNVASATGRSPAGDAVRSTASNEVVIPAVGSQPLASAESLPVTGGDTTAVLWVAAALATSGSVMVVLAQRRTAS